MAVTIVAGVELLIVLAAVGLSVFGIVDAARSPQEAWDRAGQNKVLWIVLLSFGILLDFFFLTGVIISILYLVIARPKLGRAGPGGAQPGPWGQAPGAHPGSWGQTSSTSWPPTSPTLGSPPPSTPTGDPGWATDSPIAGWYADPAGSGQKRYWDGRSWTAELRP